MHHKLFIFFISRNYEKHWNRVNIPQLLGKQTLEHLRVFFPAILIKGRTIGKEV